MDIQPVDRTRHLRQGFPASVRPDLRLAKEWISHGNTVVYTSYHGQPYPMIDNTFNQEVARAALSDKGHE
jgi:hypothetical protein